MAALLDLLRLFVGVSVLSFSAWTDMQWRRAPNVLWVILAAIGVVLLGADLALDPAGAFARWPYLVGIPAFVAVVYALWYFGLVAGGADAKALMAIGLLLPFPLALAEGIPFLASPWPGSVVVLTNSLLAFMVIPVALALWNLAHGDVRFPLLFLGVKRRAADVKRGHAWPMETVGEDGARRTRLFASRMEASEVEETFARVQALGDERVWVSPKIPFLVPLLAGFVLAFVVGDLLTGVLRVWIPSP